jgi:hypothetical protein
MTNTTTAAFGSTAPLRRLQGASAAGEFWLAANRLAQRVLRMPLLLWSLVVAAALLAFFVHLLNAQVLRGEKLREEQRAAATRPAARLALAGELQHPGNALIVTRQPMSRP